MFKKKSTKELVGIKEDTSEHAPMEAPIKPEKVKKLKEKKEKPLREKQTFQGLPVKELLKNRTVLGVGSIVLALLIAFVFTPLVEGAVSKNVEVIKLKTDIRKGAAIKNEDIEQTAVGAFGLAKDAVKVSDAVIGKFAVMDMMSGDIVTERKLSDAPQYDDAYLAELPDGKMAISIQLNKLAEGLSGKLRAGDIVRLFAYIQDNNKQEMQIQDYAAVSMPELQYVEVLSVTNSSVKDIENGQEVKENDTSEKQIATVTLAVNSKQAAILAGLNNSAELHLALVSRGSDAIKQELLAKQDEITGE